jgi:hypothetical protein
VRRCGATRQRERAYGVGVTQTYALVAFQFVAFLIILYLMLCMYRQLRRDGGAEAGRIRSDVGDLVNELRRTADQINADVSARAATLRKLVDEADEKIKRLDAVAGRLEAQRLGGAPAARAAASAARPLRPPPGDSETRRHGDAAKIGASQHPPTESATRPRAPSSAGPGGGSDEGPWPGAPLSAPTRSVPPVTAGSPAAASAYRQSSRATEGFVELDPGDAGKFQTVSRLAREGLSAAEIARRTRLGREEVELIMQLATGGGQ